MLQVGEQCRRDWENVGVFSLCRIGIVGPADDNKALTEIHILPPEAEQFAFAHPGVDGSCEDIAPIVGNMKEQERNFLGG